MRSLYSIGTLLLGIAMLLAGNGLISTLLGVRGDAEGFSSATLGLIMAAYFAGFVAGTFLVPAMIRQFGPVRIFAVLASVCSVTVLVHGLFIQPVIWLLARAVAGVCIVGIYIVIESWLNAQTSNEQRGHVFSAYMTITLIGLGLGQLLLLAGDVNSLQLFAIASALMSLCLVPVALTRVQEPPVIKTQRQGLRAMFAISPLGVAGTFFSGVGGGAFWGLGPVFAAGIGLGAGGIAGFMALTVLGGILMMWPVGRLSDRFDRRRVLAWICLLTGTSMLITYVLMTVEPLLILLGGFLYGCVGFSIYALAAAHTNDHVDQAHVLETTSSLQLLYGCGAIAGPLLAGVCMQLFGASALPLFIAVAAFVPAIFAAYRMAVSRAVPLQHQGDWVPQFVTSPVALEMLPETNGTAATDKA